MDARRLLAGNVKKLMAISPDRDSQEKVAAGAKGQISQKTVSNVLRATGPDPTLSTLEALSKSFRVPSWALLHPTLGLPIPAEGEAEFHRKLEDLMEAVRQLRRP